MLSNLVSQLKEAGQENKYRQVLEEIPRVRKDFGAAVSNSVFQIVGTQAVMNVISGERYKLVPKESKKFDDGRIRKDCKALQSGGTEEDYRKRQNRSPAVQQI